MSELNRIPVPGRLDPISKDRVLAGTDVIYDDTLGKTQAEINVGIEGIVAEKVEQSIRESAAVGDVVSAKVNERVPNVVAQALNDAVLPTVQGMVQTVDDKVQQLQSQVDGIVVPEDTNTTYRLSINGETKGDTLGVNLGAVFAPTTAGTAGKYLKSNGSGAPVWADAPSGGSEGLPQIQVEQIVYQEVYKQNTKPANVDNVTSANVLEKWEEAVANYDHSQTGGGSVLTPLINQELYGHSIKQEGDSIVTIGNLNSTLESTLAGYLKQNDVSAWAKASSKPSYNYGEISYGISKVTSEGGAVTVDATIPVHEITATGSVSGITFSGNTVPGDSHSCHIIIKASESVGVSIAHDATMATVGNTEYKSICPGSNDISLNIPTGGYIEFDLFRIGESIYIRGI